MDIEFKENFGTCCTFTFSNIVGFHIFVVQLDNIDGIRHKRDFKTNSTLRTNRLFLLFVLTKSPLKII